MLERTKIIDCNIGEEPFQATIKVLSAIEADSCLTERINDVELAKRFCEKVEGAEKEYTIEDFLNLPSSYSAFKKIVEGIATWGWLGGEVKNA